MKKQLIPAILALACAIFVSRLGYGALASVHVLALFALYAGTGDLLLAAFYGLGLLAVPLALESHMPAGGVIFSDRVEADHLDFNSGAIANIRIAPEKANLVIA